MPYTRLFILIEGNDDERFFNKVVKNKFENDYDLVMPWQYSQKTSRKIKSFIRSINAMGAEYIFAVDLHENMPCISEKKQEIMSRINNIDQNKVIVVKKEIEGWYLAGLDNACCMNLRIPTFSNTDNISKEQFKHLKPTRFESTIDFMKELLKRYSIIVAKQKNSSFRYFTEKYNC